MEFLLLMTIILTFVLYKRYFPVSGVHCINLKDLDLDKIKVIDIRDYNESHNNPVEGTMNIPISYLNRNVNEIPNSDLHLIVSNLLEKNIGIRFFRKKGFCVVGYTIVNSKHHHLFLKENSLKIGTKC
ncbi:hypothetical protein [Heyndrickxia acidiproducens]|uniref:hypothetical protein n=1 Tax=Heyndrickxia acidiproducens TaxID=1121084 RepID=UPI00036DB00B|nr:hypothetical protein [Heyndrickxia acidiproducens]